MSPWHSSNSFARLNVEEPTSDVEMTGTATTHNPPAETQSQEIKYKDEDMIFTTEEEEREVEEANRAAFNELSMDVDSNAASDAASDAPVSPGADAAATNTPASATARKKKVQKVDKRKPQANKQQDMMAEKIKRVKALDANVFTEIFKDFMIDSQADTKKPGPPNKRSRQEKHVERAMTKEDAVKKPVFLRQMTRT